MKPNPVVWFEIYVQDMARARKFYETVLQCQLETLKSPEGEAQNMQMLSFPGDMTTMGASGALVKMEGVPSGGNSTVAYFGCEDCGVEAARVEKAGGRIFKPKFSIGQYGFIALAFDTEGNLFGLHSAPDCAH